MYGDIIVACNEHYVKIINVAQGIQWATIICAAHNHVGRRKIMKPTIHMGYKHFRSLKYRYGYERFRRPLYIFGYEKTVAFDAYWATMCFVAHNTQRATTKFRSH